MTDAEFLAAFESCTLPFAQWNHRAHVRVTFATLQRHGLDAGIDRLRECIKRYNAANDVPDGPLHGYNETTTVASARIIHAVMTAYADTHPAPDSSSFCDVHPQLMSKHFLRLFYSPGQRILPEAKTTFVAPDLAPLPVAS